MNKELLNLKNKVKKINKSSFREKELAGAIRTAFTYIAKEELTEEEQKELDQAYKVLGW